MNVCLGTVRWCHYIVCGSSRIFVLLILEFIEWVSCTVSMLLYVSFFFSWTCSLLAVFRKGTRKDCGRSSGEGFYSSGKNSSYKKSTCSPWVVSFRIWKGRVPDLKRVFCSSDSITHLEAVRREMKIQNFCRRFFIYMIQQSVNMWCSTVNESTTRDSRKHL